MTQPVTAVRVFLAAPGDIREEHDVFLDTVSDWNHAHSATQSAVLEPKAWKTDCFPAAGDRPQGVINQQAVDGADILVGVFWSRFGTPTGAADSGTEEEVRRCVSAGKQVLLYFCGRAVPAEARDAAQLRRLALFRTEYEGKSLYWTYSEPAEFGCLFRQHLAMAVNRVLKCMRSDFIGVAPPHAAASQNVVSIYGGTSVNTTINQKFEQHVHRVSRRESRARKPYPEGSIGADLNMRNYAHHLTTRYNELREVDRSYGRQSRFTYGFIHKRIEQEFGSPTYFLPVSLFDAVCGFVMRYIDGTIQGKVNRAQGVPNYSSFDAFLAAQLAKGRATARGRKKA